MYRRLSLILLVGAGLPAEGFRSRYTKALTAAAFINPIAASTTRSPKCTQSGPS